MSISGFSSTSQPRLHPLAEREEKSVPILRKLRIISHVLIGTPSPGGCVCG